MDENKKAKIETKQKQNKTKKHVLNKANHPPCVRRSLLKLRRHQRERDQRLLVSGTSLQCSSVLSSFRSAEADMLSRRLASGANRLLTT